MKWIRSLAVAIFTLSLLAGNSTYALSCCTKALLLDKKCTHPCCVAAAKEGKACEKCNTTCCEKAAALEKKCAHQCCIDAAKEGKGCEKCKATCCDTALGQGKKCKHPCCVAAVKEGKFCEKCNPPKKEEKKSQS